MANEVIGGVAVQITGDVSQLNAALGSAVSIAGVAGGKVAGAFNTGAAGANEFTAATEAAAAAEGEFAGATEVANAALGHQVSQLQATSGAIRTALGEQSIRAAERFLTMIPGLGAALQYAFPVIGALALFEAVSRVIGKSEELKAAEKELADSTQKADEAFSHMEETLDRLNVSHVTAAFGAAAGKGAETSVLEQQLKRVQTQADDARDAVNQLAYAEASSLKNYIPFHSADASVAKLKAAGEDIKNLNSAILELQGRIAQGQEDTARALTEQAGQLQTARVNAEVQANAHLQALNKAYSDESIAQSHAAVQIQIAAMHDREAAAVATAAEELRVAQAKEAAITSALNSEVPKRIALIGAAGAAESAGKSQPERDRISVETGTKVGDYQAEADAKVLAAHEEVTRAQTALDVAQGDHSRQVAEQLAAAWERSYDAITKAAKETSDAISKGVERQLQVQLRVIEIQTKGAGDQRALQIQAQKIALEAQYGAQVTHSAAQKISQAQALAGFDAQERAAKLQGLQDELREAQALDSTVRDKEKEAKLEVQIAELKQRNANADAQASATLDQMNQKLTQQLSLQQQIDSATNAASSTLQSNNQQLGQQLGNAVGNLPKEVGDDIGNSIANALLGHHPGESIGQAMGKALVASLKATAAKLLSQLISTGVQFAAMGVGFASGTDSAPGGMALVGEKGPEIMHVPRGAEIIPNHAIHKYADGTPGYASTHYQSTAFQTGTTNLSFHAHGMSDPERFIDHVMRKLPETLKRRSPQFSPLSR